MVSREKIYIDFFKSKISLIGIKHLKEKLHRKPRRYVELLIVMQLQLKFELILTSNKTVIGNCFNF
jgi:hypothetical protein